MSAPPKSYRAFGQTLLSDWELPFPVSSSPCSADVTLEQMTAEDLSKVSDLPSEGGVHRSLADGSDHLRWAGLFEFLVSPNGARVACRSFEGASHEAFTTYLLGQVLSFAFIRRGIDALHATAVVVDEAAIGFAAQPGAGKSTLASVFLRDGYALLTDDLLVLRVDDGAILAQPGIPRIKLFPEIAEAVLGEHRTGGRMNPFTNKEVIPLDATEFHGQAAAMSRLYVLKPTATTKITVRRLSARGAFLELVGNTFNTAVVEPSRLSRHLTQFAAVTARLAVKSLSYPRELSRLDEVRDAVLRDLRR